MQQASFTMFQDFREKCLRGIFCRIVVLPLVAKVAIHWPPITLEDASDYLAPVGCTSVTCSNNPGPLRLKKLPTFPAANMCMSLMSQSNIPSLLITPKCYAFQSIIPATTIVLFFRHDFFPIHSSPNCNSSIFASRYNTKPIRAKGHRNYSGGMFPQSQ